MNKPLAFRRKRRPEGVDDALWAYASSHRLAQDENAHFEDHPLIQSDIKWVLDRLGDNHGLVVDLGCGAGRASTQLASQGWNVLAVDLSLPMLEQLKCEVSDSEPFTDQLGQCAQVLPVQANLARLDFLPQQSLDAAICLFSTLGMMRRETDRRRCLSVVSAALKPNGCLLLHAHNWFVQATTWQGLRWLMRDSLKRCLKQPEFSNRGADYRGIPGIHIHLFTWWEIAELLDHAGFELLDALAIDSQTAQPLQASWINRRFRAGGWLIHARKRDS